MNKILLFALLMTFTIGARARTGLILRASMMQTKNYSLLLPVKSPPFIWAIPLPISG